MLSKNYSGSHEKPQKYEDKYLKYLKKTLIYNSIFREIKVMKNTFSDKKFITSRSVLQENDERSSSGRKKITQIRNVNLH